MARPITCPAGYPIPLKVGKYDIVGYSVAPSAVTTQMDICILDDETLTSNNSYGNMIDTEDNALKKKHVLHFSKVVASSGSYDFMFAEPVKVVHGLSIYCTNVLAGSFCVYMR